MQVDDLLLLIFAGLVIAVALFAIARWRRIVRIQNASVLIGEAMQLRGIEAADAEAAGLEAEVFVAARRCKTCAAESECRALLSTSSSVDLPSECLNRAFFDHVAAHKAANPAPKSADAVTKVASPSLS